MNPLTYLLSIVIEIYHAIMRNILIAHTRIIAGIWTASFYRLTVNKPTMSGNEIKELWRLCHDFFYFSSKIQARMALIHFLYGCINVVELFCVSEK